MVQNHLNFTLWIYIMSWEFSLNMLWPSEYQMLHKVDFSNRWGGRKLQRRCTNWYVGPM